MNRELNKVPPEGKEVVDIFLIAQVGKEEEEGAKGDDNDRGRECQCDEADVGEECCQIEKDEPNDVERG